MSDKKVPAARPARRRPSWIGLLRDESGAAYSLPLVLTAPIYGLMMATVVEAALLLNARIGLQYAAHAAARAAVVWAPAEVSESQRLGMIELAAVNAMTPFASGQSRHARSASGGTRVAADLLEAYDTYSSGAAPDDYLARKWSYAAASTGVAIEVDSDEHDSPTTVVVAYDAPINLPLVGRFLGTHQSGGGYSYRLIARATLGLERPKSEDQTLGITYGRELGYTSNAPVKGSLRGKQP